MMISCTNDLCVKFAGVYRLCHGSVDTPIDGVDTRRMQGVTETCALYEQTEMRRVQSPRFKLNRDRSVVRESDSSQKL
ncbi:hypothetical protein Taro_039906, partial [Colocasia esculenta]|nr:hypothetical protein [Colocasia esculenta]